MKTINGTQLNPDGQRLVLAAYIYRNTVENKRTHADAVKLAGSRLQPITDGEWLAKTQFAATNSGRLDNRFRHCNP